ncbi:hypothetical protein ACS0TY_028493 [Phlomoides rotata]
MNSRSWELSFSMAGTHRERLESLERRLDLVEINLNDIALQVTKGNDANKRLKKIMKHLLRQQPDGKSVGSSSGESDALASDSEKEENPTYDEAQEEKRTKGPSEEEQRRGRPKLTCPTFCGDDQISWLSRAQQYFDLIEISKEDKLKYAAYYMEGETNVWWQWLSRVYRKRGTNVLFACRPESEQQVATNLWELGNGSYSTYC